MTQTDHAWTRMPVARARQAYVACFLVGLVLFLADLSPTTGVVVAVACAALTGLAVRFGPRLNGIPVLPGWQRDWAVCVAFLAVPAVRHLGDVAGAPVTVVADVLVVAGYLMLLSRMVVLLRQRGAHDADMALDAVVVAVGAALVSLSFLVVPTLHDGHLPWWGLLRVLVVPVLDVTVLALLVSLAFTSRRGVRAAILIRSAAVLLLVGDLGNALLARDGNLVGSPLVDAAYLVAFGLVGLAVLDPSLALLSAGRPGQVQPWSWQRLVVLVPALLVPSVLILSGRDLPTLARVVQAAGVVVLVVAVLVRAGRAVRQHNQSRRVFEQLATTDALTGLANRAALLEWLDGSLAVGNHVQLLFIDLDGFKMVNDSWGHSVGDELLVQVSRRMSDQLPPRVRVFRVGGDEFILVVPSRDGDLDGTAFARHVLAELAEPYDLSVGEVVLTTSIGIAATQRGVRPSAADLIRDADTAMYRAKDGGRNRAVSFEPSMGELVRRRVELDRALRKALGRGELDVAFQPIVDLAAGELLGFEALARWNRPDDGPCTPDVFIAAAEDNGLILPIGDFVLNRALDEVQVWRATSPFELSVNVNVSGRQLQDPEFVGRVLAALTARELTARSLRLEVTESTLIGDDPVAVQSLRQLERAGVSLSVDDFGTGYSSLSYLSRLQVHEVKVDRTFVAGLTTRPEDHAIVRATAAMAQALGLDVVAEGIETLEQAQSLVELGITRGQGWWLGRPMPADRAAAMVGQEWQPLRTSVTRLGDATPLA